MKESEIYSMQRYVDGNGVPIFERIFDVRYGSLEPSHLNSKLMEIIFHQPDTVQEMARNHIKKCQECRDKYFPKEHKQGDKI